MSKLSNIWHFTDNYKNSLANFFSIRFEHLATFKMVNEDLIEYITPKVTLR